MENGKSPSWLQELLDHTEDTDQNRLLEMNKLRADQALAAIGVVEDKIAEIEQLAQNEIDLITSWKELETRNEPSRPKRGMQIRSPASWEEPDASRYLFLRQFE